MGIGHVIEYEFSCIFVGHQVFMQEVGVTFCHLKAGSFKFHVYTHHLGHFPLTFQTLCLVRFMYYQIKFWNLDIPVFRYRIQDKCGYLHVFLWSSLQDVVPFFEHMFTV